MTIEHNDLKINPSGFLIYISCNKIYSCIEKIINFQNTFELDYKIIFVTEHKDEYVNNVKIKKFENMLENRCVYDLELIEYFKFLVNYFEKKFYYVKKIDQDYVNKAKKEISNVCRGVNIEHKWIDPDYDKSNKEVYMLLYKEFMKDIPKDWLLYVPDFIISLPTEIFVTETTLKTPSATKDFTFNYAFQKQFKTKSLNFNESRIIENSPDNTNKFGEKVSNLDGIDSKSSFPKIGLEKDILNAKQEFLANITLSDVKAKNQTKQIFKKNVHLTETDNFITLKLFKNKNINVLENLDFANTLKNDSEIQYKLKNLKRIKKKINKFFNKFTKNQHINRNKTDSILDLNLQQKTYGTEYNQAQFDKIRIENPDSNIVTSSEILIFAIFCSFIIFLVGMFLYLIFKQFKRRINTVQNDDDVLSYTSIDGNVQ